MSKKKKKPDYTAFEDRETICPHFDVCGGCSMQKVSYEKQLQIKSEEVCRLLGIGISAEDGSVPVSRDCFEGILPSPRPEGYRNKMEFTFGDECKGGEFSLGLHMKGSFMNIVNITDCHLNHPDMNLVRNAVRNYFSTFYNEGLLKFHNNKTHEGYLRHLLVRRAEKTGEILVALVTTSQFPEGVIHEEAVLEDLKNLLLSLPVTGRITGVLHIVNDALSDTVQSDRTDILYGRDFIYEEVLGLKFKVSVFSFFQTNTLGAEVLYTKAREYASSAHGTLFDLYSGTGTIAQLMSPAVEQVYGVEIVGEAVEAAKENAAQNGITNAQFIAADVLKALDTLPTPDSLILDPPREGINPKALGKILSYGVEHIVYVSCKPTSLARDMEAIRLAGYEIQKACCIDMFPQTPNVETVVLMSKVNPNK